MEITRQLIEGPNGEIFLHIKEDHEDIAKLANNIKLHTDGWTEDRTMRCNLRLPPREYYLWESRERGCWQDPAFVRSYMREHPEYCTSNARSS